MHKGLLLFFTAFLCLGSLFSCKNEAGDVGRLNIPHTSTAGIDTAHSRELLFELKPKHTLQIPSIHTFVKEYGYNDYTSGIYNQPLPVDSSCVANYTQAKYGAYYLIDHSVKNEIPIEATVIVAYTTKEFWGWDYDTTQQILGVIVTGKSFSMPGTPFAVGDSLSRVYPLFDNVCYQDNLLVVLSNAEYRLLVMLDDNQIITQYQLWNCGGCEFDVMRAVEALNK